MYGEWRLEAFEAEERGSGDAGGELEERALLLGGQRGDNLPELVDRRV